MSSPPLEEHRCSCGKLLFKGLLSVCRIEVKCRRCSAINTFSGEANHNVAFSLLVDERGRVVEVCTAASLLSPQLPVICGELVPDFLATPSTHAARNAADSAFSLSRRTLLLRDGSTRMLESGAVTLPAAADVPARYRVFGILH